MPLFHFSSVMVRHKEYFSLTFLGDGLAVSLVTRLRAGRPGFDARQGNKVIFFLFGALSTPALGPTEPSIQ